MADPNNRDKASLVCITDDHYIAQHGDTHYAVIIRELGDDQFRWWSRAYVAPYAAPEIPSVGAQGEADTPQGAFRQITKYWGLSSAAEAPAA